MGKKLFRFLLLCGIVYGAYYSYAHFLSGVEIGSFDPVKNSNSKDTSFTVDLSDAVYRGIEIPSVKQLPNGKLTFSFSFKNKNIRSRKYFYKIYYQNESYKIPEFEERNGFKYENAACTKNFYGSWGEIDNGFRETAAIGWNEETTITDSFRIVGNPRNENMYFGHDDNSGISSVKIANMINYINSQVERKKALERKAAENGRTLEQQIYSDAIWQIQNDRKFSNVNQRWKRNPRMGKYKFMLVVTTQEGLNTLPVSVRNVTQREPDGRFINPFYYFLYGRGSIEPSVHVLVSKKQLNIKAKFSPGSGVYVNPFEFAQSGIDTISYCLTCGTDSILYHKAQFAQFFASEDRSHILPTIPVTANVVKDNYLRETYDLNKGKYTGDPIYLHYGDHRSELVNDHLRGAKRPCETVLADALSDAILLSNPGNVEMPYRKESVGVRSRIGFTYGKIDVCVQFPELLSKDHVWNGLTNSIWMINQEEAEWDQRTGCQGGFISRNDTRGSKAERKEEQSFSEIDLNIVKTSVNWPNTSYNENARPLDDHPSQNSNVIFACSNWDLACREPKNYITGFFDFVHDQHHYPLHRWDSWYQAITIKVAVDHDEVLKKPFYWYEIEWTPESITWRIGPDKKHLKDIAFMDKTVTVIPDNQMAVVVSQEFQDSQWWVPAPFDQRYIPYPRDPIVGKILAVEVQ